MRKLLHRLRRIVKSLEQEEASHIGRGGTTSRGSAPLLEEENLGLAIASQFFDAGGTRRDILKLPRQAESINPLSALGYCRRSRSGAII